jgi:acetyl-CoA carboxylase, biotin carboxylase subunit
MRRRMGETAVQAAKAANYSNAGTIEFLADSRSNFYFLEMNTRLQVEHPITELVTGLDLVHLQIRIAAAEKLPFTQEDIQLRGHAIECRVYAEDPDNNFFPSPGRISSSIEPSGPGIRLDSGVYPGWNVGTDYDPLLSKLVSYGADRDQAIARIRRAIGEYVITGVKTNLSLFRRILTDPDFLAGKTDTGYLSRLFSKSPPEPHGHQREIAVIAAAIYSALDLTNGKRTPAKDPVPSQWKHAARAEAME